MNLLQKFKELKNCLYGSWMFGIVEDIKCTTSHVCDKIDELRQQTRINGEAHWMDKDSASWPPEKQAKDTFSL